MTVINQIAPIKKTGTVLWFDLKKGYGFIGEKGARGDDWFVHTSELMDGDLSPGDAVTFNAGVNRDGKPCAKAVERA
jgi:cold shock CspA family protein